MAKFVLRPQPLVPTVNSFIVEHIARNSFRQVEGGWASKYDTAQVEVVNLRVTAVAPRPALAHVPVASADGAGVGEGEGVFRVDDRLRALPARSGPRRSKRAICRLR